MMGSLTTWKGLKELEGQQFFTKDRTLIRLGFVWTTDG